MFTGLSEQLGIVVHAGVKLRVRLQSGALPQQGQSIAVDGCCLTVVAAQALSRGACLVTFNVANESSQRTTLPRLVVGDQVHIERALTVGAALDGHLVLGHVDGLGKLIDKRVVGESVYLGIAAPPELRGLLVPRGSIAILGISLTITEVKPASNRAYPEIFYVNLIPHTLKTTKLARIRLLDLVNLEADVMARYARGEAGYLQALSLRSAKKAEPSKSARIIDMDYLREQGLI